MVYRLALCVAGVASANAKIEPVVDPAATDSGAVSGGSGGWQAGTTEEGQAMQSMQIEAPVLSEEDQYGPNMPALYACEGCRAVLFNVDMALAAKTAGRSTPLKEWEVMDALEGACAIAEGYGVRRNSEGNNALSGPGLPTSEPGLGGAMIQYGGEAWNKRVASQCRELVSETFEESAIYDLWRAGDLSHGRVCMPTKHCADKRADKRQAKAERKAQKKEERRLKKVAQTEAKKMHFGDFVRHLERAGRLHGAAEKRTVEEWERELKKALAVPSLQRAEL